MYLRIQFLTALSVTLLSFFGISHAEHLKITMRDSIMNDAKLYVGNLDYDTSESMLRDIFGEHGSIAEVNLIADRLTGQSKGFAFITF